MDRRATLVGLALVVVTAGCNAPVTTTDVADVTVTPASVPEPEEPTTYPPGLSAQGIEDPRRLAQAHAAAVTNRSYTWTLAEIRYRSATVNVDRLTIRRTGPATYNGTLLQELRRRSGVLDRRTMLYADGEYRYTSERDDGEVSYTRSDAWVRGGGEGQYEETAETFAEQYLTVARASVTPLDNGRFRVVGRGTTDRYPGRESYMVVATVRSSGLIEELTVRFAGSGQDSVEVRWSYIRVGTTTLSVPEWYPAARNATDSRTTAAG